MNAAGHALRFGLAVRSRYGSRASCVYRGHDCGYGFGYGRMEASSSTIYGGVLVVSGSCPIGTSVAFRVHGAMGRAFSR